MKRNGALAVLLLLASSACIPLPYATPPATLSVQGGGSEAAGGVFAFRAGVAPAGLLEPLVGRPWDAELGYTLETSREYVRQGGYLLGRFWPVRGLDAPQALRFGAQAGASLFAGGAGAQAGLVFEFASFVSGPHTSLDDADADHSDGAYVGAHLGEAGIGVTVDGAWRQVGGLQEWLVLAGLTFRLPAAAGLLLVPLWGADDE